MEHALRIIITRSGRAASEAMRTLDAIRTNSPVVQQRYNQAVELAFSDPDAIFLPEERAILAEHVTTAEGDTRDSVLHIRLTFDERTRLEADARAQGMTLSDYARGRLFATD